MFHCHSNDRGWHFVHKRIRDSYEPMIQVAEKALEALGLDFGGVDVIISNGEPIVIEVNTGVGLGKSGLKKYAEAIADDLGLEVDYNQLEEMWDDI